jgi:hypothetical protein
MPETNTLKVTSTEYLAWVFPAAAPQLDDPTEVSNRSLGSSRQAMRSGGFSAIHKR